MKNHGVANPWLVSLIAIIVIVGAYFLLTKKATAPVSNPDAMVGAGWQDIVVKEGNQDYTITKRELLTPAGKTFQEVLINDVVFDGSGLHPESFAKFTARHLGTHDFYFIQTGRFEGVLSFNYYLSAAALAKEGLSTGDKIHVFTLVSRGVDWTNPNFDPEQDPGHLKLKELLAKL